MNILFKSHSFVRRMLEHHSVNDFTFECMRKLWNPPVAGAACLIVFAVFNTASLIRIHMKKPCFQFWN